MNLDWRPPTLEIPRLILRPVTPADAAAVFLYASNPAVTRFTLFETHQTIDDSRWFVVRNAAELLGKIGAHDAEQSLCALLTHDDERVRGSATIALVQLGTDSGRSAVVGALDDSARTVRLYAVAALATGSPALMAPPVIRALESERDEEVQAACLGALGRLATPDAVEQLVAYAQPSRGLFKRNAVSVRLAAVQALGRVGAPVARAALTTLADDSVEEISELARGALTTRRGRRPALSR